MTPSTWWIDKTQLAKQDIVQNKRAYGNVQTQDILGIWFRIRGLKILSVKLQVILCSLEAVVL